MLRTVIAALVFLASAAAFAQDMKLSDVYELTTVEPSPQIMQFSTRCECDYALKHHEHADGRKRQCKKLSSQMVASKSPIFDAACSGQ